MIQRQTEQEEEEKLQTGPLPEVTGLSIQRQVEEEEEEVQAKSLSGDTVPLKKQVDEEEEETVQVKGFSGQTRDEGPSPELSISNLRGGGRPLPESTLAFFELRFGADFGQVRVHTDTRAVQMAQAYNARAITTGRDVVFGAGQNVPNTHEGKRLIAHELTHVVQQTGPSRLSEAKGASLPVQRNIFGIALTEREKIDKALQTRDSDDVKKIDGISQATEAERIQLIQILAYQGWVGPFDEYKIEEIWRSFGDQLSRVMAAHTALWHHCISVGAELDELSAVKKLKANFVQDIKEVVTGYLSNNREVVLTEMDRLGIAPAGAVEAPLLTTEQADEMQKMQDAAAAVAKLQKAQEEARDVYVGYDLVEIDIPADKGGGTTQSCVPSRFDPYRKPDMESPLTGVASFFTPCLRVPIKPHDEVKEKYGKATTLINGFIRHYPVLYAISREGKSATTAEFAGISSPEKAREQLGKAMRQLIKDIENTQSKLLEGVLDPLDLTPIHDQLYAGKKTNLGIGWNDPLPNWAARELVKDHEFSNALKTLGLQTAAAALFLLAPFTGGATLYVALAGLAVTGIQAYRSTQQYESLAQAARTSVVPGTKLVTPPQVDEAKMQMEADQVALALAVLAVGTMAAGKLIGTIKGPASKIPPKEGGIESLGYRPKPGERSIGREQWKAIDRARRIAKNPPQINVKHIFHGEINPSGKPVGFHHRGSTIRSAPYARIIPNTESPPNGQGVYTAKVQIFKPSTGNWVTKQSTFFPDSWSRSQVLAEIRGAFQNAHLIKGKFWEGISPSGVRIQGYVEGGVIRTAYPIY